MSRLEQKNITDIINEYKDAANLTQTAQDARKLAVYALEIEKAKDILHSKIEELKAGNKRIEAEKNALMTAIEERNKTLEGAYRVINRKDEELDELRKQVKKLEANILQIHKDHGCEIRDPNGTIWQHAKNLEEKIKESEAEIARLKVASVEYGGL